MLVNVDKEQLKKLRLEQNLSQRKLALKSQLSINAIFRMEECDHKVSELRLKQVSKALHCKTSDLIKTEK